MFALEGIVNKVAEAVHKLWKCNGEKFETKKNSLEGHFLLLQLNSSCES